MMDLKLAHCSAYGRTVRTPSTLSQDERRGCSAARKEFSPTIFSCFVCVIAVLIVCVYVCVCG